MNLVHVKEKLERFRASAARVREQAKAGTKLVVHTAVAAATAGALGAYDQAKGVAATDGSDMGVVTANIGPVPAALGVAAVGKVAAFMQLGDETGELASAVGQGALDAWAYVEGRRLYIKHQQSAAKTS